MEDEIYFLEKKYGHFTNNIKKSLKKAIQRNNFELVIAIKEYLETVDEIKRVSKLNKNNNLDIFKNDIKMYEKQLDKLQKKIISVQFNSSTFDNNKIIIDIPKYINSDLNYIFMFIYKFLHINRTSICIVFKNIVDDLFQINLLNDDSQINLCSSKILENINIVYNQEKIKYIYRIPLDADTTTLDVKKNIDELLEKINTYDVNKKLETYGLKLETKTIKEIKLIFATMLINILKDVNCNNKLTNIKLKQYLCDYFTFNPTYKINKEFNLLYNNFLTRKTIDKKPNTITQLEEEDNIHMIIPHISISFINNLVLLVYVFLKNNKKDICNNLLTLLKYIKQQLIKYTYSNKSSGSYLYQQYKILSMCSNNSEALKIINTFYLKYENYDKILISNLLLKIIENNCLKISYDSIKNTFTAVIINIDKINVDFDNIDKTKLLSGLNNDLKCINEEINKNIIITLIEFIQNGINVVLSIITNNKLLTNILNLSTESKKFINNIRNPNINFKIRKLVIIIFIKFLVVHMSKFYTDPYSTEFNMYDSLINDIHKHLCEKLTVEFSYNIFEKLEKLYQEFPTYQQDF